jgi:hypothetical protein
VYPLGARAVPLESFTDLVDRGELQDATAIAALFLAQRFLEQEK